MKFFRFASLVSMLLPATVAFLSACASTGAGRTATHTFSSACLKHASAEYCLDLESRIFKNKLPLQEFSVWDFNLPDFPADSETEFVEIYDAKYAPPLGYCYFVSRQRLDQEAVSPVDFFNVDGFAVMKSDIPAYEAWLSTEAGMRCRQHMEKVVGLPLIDLKARLNGKSGLVALNPVSMAASNAALKHIFEGIRIILNHERIHILQSGCPAVNDFAEKELSKYDPQKLAELKKQMPEYNWSNPQVELREFLAFTYELDPTLLLRIAKGCNSSPDGRK